MRKVRFGLCAGVVAMVLAGTAAADVSVANAWLRPAYAGQSAALVYLDVHSTETLNLVAARSPAAASARLVLVDPPGAEAEFHKVVEQLPVAANNVTRLAYLGSHVRLIDVRQDLASGDRIALELTFVDAKAYAAWRPPRR